MVSAAISPLTSASSPSTFILPKNIPIRDQTLPILTHPPWLNGTNLPILEAPTTMPTHLGGTQSPSFTSPSEILTGVSRIIAAGSSDPSHELGASSQTEFFWGQRPSNLTVSSFQSSDMQDLYSVSSTSPSASDGFNNSTDFATIDDEGGGSGIAPEKLWQMLLLVFPVLAVFGNVLVIMAVYRERSLRTATNYFIVNLAIADLLVAGFVMPLALADQIKGLRGRACDLWFSLDVICSTSSIFSLVAISVDRYVAVTRPIAYAQHGSQGRLVATIIVIWITSTAIGVPFMGINNNEDTNNCQFTSPLYLIVSSIFSFFLPCFVMVFLYYQIFKAIRRRAQKPMANKRPKLPAPDVANTTVIENVAQTRRLADTSLSHSPQHRRHNIDDGSASNLRPPKNEDIDEDRPSNSAYNSQDEDCEDDPVDNCYVIQNIKSQDVVLTSLKEEKSESSGGTSGSSGAHDGVAPEESLEEPATREALLHQQNNSAQNKVSIRTNGTQKTCSPATVTFLAPPSDDTEASNSRGSNAASLGTDPPSSTAPYDEEEESGDLLNKKERKSSVARFTMHKVNKASKKKREKSTARRERKTTARRERKTTITLAVVLGVFLLCWAPFFICSNLMSWMEVLGGTWMNIGHTPFLVTTWIGYINSFLNPVIYTIFNSEFRKAFKKILSTTCKK